MRVRLFHYIIILSFLLAEKNADAQQDSINWQVVSPSPNTVIPVGPDLFIALNVNRELKFKNGMIKISLDGESITTNIKTTDNNLSVLSGRSLSVGKHKIEIRTMFIGVKGVKYFTWDFFWGSDKADTSVSKNPIRDIILSGDISVDNRSEFLSGQGAALRQEPEYTRTIEMNINAKYKNIMVPFRFFGTTDNSTGLQSRNYFQTGIIYKGFEVLVGDINPDFDKLVLCGVRVWGAMARYKWRNNSVQIITGDLNQAQEGILGRYDGSGIPPPNIRNDSTYIIPGIYKRKLYAAKVEFGNLKDYYKIGFTALKAIDDTTSIKYGTNPKDNVVAGTDLTLKLFKKKLLITGGAALSVISNDILRGPVSKAAADSAFSTTLTLDPSSVSKILIINTSTSPLAIPQGGFSSHYVQMSFANTQQSFSFDYKKISPVYQSLGNPFLRNNYEGYGITERVFLLQRKITLTASYQNFSNNLSENQMAKIFTGMFAGTMAININKYLPQFFYNVTNQTRNTENSIADYGRINDHILTNTVGLNYSREQWNIEHAIRFFYSNNFRQDLIRPETGTEMNAFSAGITEKYFKKYTTSIQYERTFMNQNNQVVVSDINSWSVLFRYEVIEKKLDISTAINNSSVAATTLSSASNRFSWVTKVGYRFYKVMFLTFEYGTQPYTERNSDLRNYNDQYVYVKYTYEFTKH